MPHLNKILKIGKDPLMSLENVVGVGRGFKVTNGKTTANESLVVLVSKKVPQNKLNRKQKVPTKVYDVATDVIEVGDIRFLSRTDFIRPVPSGVSIGNYRISAGTLGALVYDVKTGQPLILSNNHVLANSSNGHDNRCKLGDPIYQPGPYDGGTKDDVIAYLERFVPLEREYSTSSCVRAAKVEEMANSFVHKFKPNYNVNLVKKTANENLVDAAVAKPLSPNLILPEILEIGLVKGVNKAIPGLKIKKSGRSTGFNEGVVRVVDATLKVAYDDGATIVFTDQIVATPMANPGDSGSLVLDKNNNAVGLLFAGSEVSTIINKISHVTDLLKIRF